MSDKDQRWTMPFLCPSCKKGTTSPECRFCKIDTVENTRVTNRA